MSINKDWAPAELLHLIVCLRHGYARSKKDADEESDTRVFNHIDFQACNGTPHKDTERMYDRRRMEKYALHMLTSWCEYATTKGKSGNKPPSLVDWRQLGTLLDQYNQDTQYDSDDLDVDDLDGEASEQEEIEDDEEEEEEEQVDDADDDDGNAVASDDDNGDDDREGDDYVPVAEEDDDDDDDDATTMTTTTTTLPL